MALDQRYGHLRDIINECCGYRVLDDDDVLSESDETSRASTMFGPFHEGWLSLSRPALKFLVGHTVRDMNDPSHNNEMDTTERLFRRKL